MTLREKLSNQQAALEAERLATQASEQEQVLKNIQVKNIQVEPVW